MKRLKRAFVIDKLRAHLARFTDDEHSICSEAGRRGIFCHGFRRLETKELVEKYDWIVRSNHPATREKLEELANTYALARQEVRGKAFACDAAEKDRETCVGWDEFSDQQLAAFYRAWLGEEVEVLPVLPTHP